MTTHMEASTMPNEVSTAPAGPLLRMEIDAVLAEWGWCLDHHDLDGVLDVFTDDARFAPSPGVEVYGRARIRQRYTTRIGPRTTRHIYSNLRVEVVSSAWVRAESTWTTYAANQDAPVAEAVTYQVADFHDLLTRCADGRWRICDRRIVSIFRDPTRAPVSA